MSSKTFKVIGILLTTVVLPASECYKLDLYLDEDYSVNSIDPEVWMDATELVTSKGFPAENYWVTTEDGYILNILRIPSGRNSTKTKAPKPVVVVQHGFTACCSSFLMNLVNESLPFLLADAGADVWLPNSRGTRYSTNHTTLDPSHGRFWNFSYDEMARYDLPATVDFILQETNQSQVYYVGHSQGTTIAFAGFSQNKTLASRIKYMMALAPVAKLQYVKSPIRYLAPFASSAGLILDLLGHGKIGGSSASSRHLQGRVCALCKECQALCSESLFLMGGHDYKHINMTRSPVYIAHGSGGTSFKDLLHWAQGIDSKKFQMFDYGPFRNRRHYGQRTPPKYHPENITVPVAAFYGTHDLLADPRDVDWLLPKLPNLRRSILYKGYCHTSFTCAWNAARGVYKEVMEIIFKEPK